MLQIPSISNTTPNILEATEMFLTRRGFNADTALTQLSFVSAFIGESMKQNKEWTRELLIKMKKSQIIVKNDAFWEILLIESVYFWKQGDGLYSSSSRDNLRRTIFIRSWRRDWSVVLEKFLIDWRVEANLLSLSCFIWYSDPETIRRLEKNDGRVAEWYSIVFSIEIVHSWIPLISGSGD